jgi:glutamine amidotransferase
MNLVLDIGLGNIGSLLNMFRYLGIEARGGASEADIASATRILIPGVGSFDQGMRCMEQSGVIPLLRHRVLVDGIPLLGICLGMQLLGSSSEEGTSRGLGLIPMHTVRFSFPKESSALRVPHMGWNECEPVGQGSLLDPVPAPRRFYFVHSYHVVCDDPADVSGLTHYGVPFASAIRRGNIFGVQFHPEKSHRYGMALLESFMLQH